MGRTYWITGLSGAGKTTVGRILYEELKKRNNATVLLDGDELRQVFGNDLGYTQEERLKSATRNSRICALLSNQGIDVICCTISMFDNVRKWNRENIDDYVEIYLSVSMETLRERNQKDLYSTNDMYVAGVDVKVEIPQHPDILLDNDGYASPRDLVSKILSYIEKKEGR